MPLRICDEWSVRSKLKVLRTKSKAALTFGRSLGIDVESKISTDSETCKRSVVNLKETSQDCSLTTAVRLSKASVLYGNASENEGNAGGSSKQTSVLPNSTSSHTSYPRMQKLI